MDPKDAAMLVLMFVVFGAPALALAARLVIRPITDAMDRLGKGVTVTPNVLPDPRVDELEAEVSQLKKEVHRLAEAEAFHRQLLESPKQSELTK